MRILKHEHGYVNAEMIESYGLKKEGEWWQIRAYTVMDDCAYTLGRSMSEETAQKRLDYLVEWLAANEHGLLDIMDIWEGDYE